MGLSFFLSSFLSFLGCIFLGRVLVWIRALVVLYFLFCNIILIIIKTRFLIKYFSRATLYHIRMHR